MPKYSTLAHLLLGKDVREKQLRIPWHDFCLSQNWWQLQWRQVVSAGKKFPCFCINQRIIVKFVYRSLYMKTSKRQRLYDDNKMATVEGGKTGSTSTLYNTLENIIHVR